MRESRAPEVTDLNGQIIAEFRANGGKVGGPFEGSDILLLHHTGAQTGTERVSPLSFQWVGESLAVFAGVGGGPTNPAWFYNLRANPLTIVEVGTQKITVRARIAEPTEREVICGRQKQRNPEYAQYEAKVTPRRIPVVVLDPIK